MARSCSPHMAGENRAPPSHRRCRNAPPGRNLQRSTRGRADVVGVTLTNGLRLEANICLFAIGASPNIHLARDAGLACENGILVDEFMRTIGTRVFWQWAIVRRFPVYTLAFRYGSNVSKTRMNKRPRPPQRSLEPADPTFLHRCSGQIRRSASFRWWDFLMEWI